MTWRDVAYVWHQMDGAVMTGVAAYLYVSRRQALKKLRHATGLVHSLLAVAKSHGLVVVIDPRDGTGETRRLH